MPHAPALVPVLLALAALLTPAAPAAGDVGPAGQVGQGTEANRRAAAHAAVERGVFFLRGAQQADGGWSTGPGPAVTGLVVALLLDAPGIGPDDPAVARGVAYLLDRVQADGSIRDGADGILANYNTAICLSALSRLARLPDNPAAANAVAGAQAFLTGLQWKPGMTTPDGTTLTDGHPFVGGAGYGRHGRPDMSNTQVMLQGLYDSGLDADDPAFARALTFIARCQGIAENDFFPEGTLVNDGGVIYATSINREHPEIPVSYANPDAVDAARAGRPVSGLRGYGSMTYAAFKSFAYADLAPDDPRVVGARAWIAANYTLDQNPGMPAALGQQGLYYYYLTHARALSAWGEPTLDVADGEPIDWAAALIDRLTTLQRDDGSFVNAEGRWMEDDPVLVTAYALTALLHAAAD